MPTKMGVGEFGVGGLPSLDLPEDFFRANNWLNFDELGSGEGEEEFIEEDWYENSHNHSLSQFPSSGTKYFVSSCSRDRSRQGFVAHIARLFGEAIFYFPLILLLFAVGVS